MNRAFSLVELSIVLVILGLLTGGILAGQSLIRAAELRSVSTQFNQYMAATQTFRDKYMALPGDMTNATRFWGAAHATPATCRTTASTSALTCDGNGDGNIIDNGTTSNESYRFWQQLANAGLIEGSYSGITQGTNAYSSTTANSPVGKLGNSLWFMWWWPAPYTGQTGTFDGNYANFMQIGGSATNAHPIRSIFKPEEAWNIDTKMDDGKPGIGKVVIYAESGTSACSTTVGNNGATLSADYLLTGTSAACTLLFRSLF